MITLSSAQSSKCYRVIMCKCMVQVRFQQSYREWWTFLVLTSEMMVSGILNLSLLSAIHVHCSYCVFEVYLYRFSHVCFWRTRNAFSSSQVLGPQLLLKEFHHWIRKWQKVKSKTRQHNKDNVEIVPISLTHSQVKMSQSQLYENWSFCFVFLRLFYFTNFFHIKGITN